MIQRFKLNMVPHAEQMTRGANPPVVHVSQYDKGLRTLVFTLYNGADLFKILTGYTAKILGTKPDGNAFEYAMTIEDENSVSIVDNIQMTAVAGQTVCEVAIFGANAAQIGSANFILCVEPAAVDADQVLSDTDIPVFNQILYGGEVGQVLTRTRAGADWADPGTDSNIMLKSEYDPDDDGSVLKADHADDASTVDGFTVARNVLADEYTNAEIDTMIGAAGTVKSVNSVSPDANGEVTLVKADLGLGNVDNTSDADKPISTATQAALDLKVDKVSGKGLSENDFTDALKNKLDDIETGAEVNVQADWNETNSSADDYIKNKPAVDTAVWGKISGTLADQTDLKNALDAKQDAEAGKGLSTEDFTTADKTKLAGIADNAEVNVQANWTEADSSSDAYIQNKPAAMPSTWGTISGTLADQEDLATELSSLSSGIAAKQDILTFDDAPTAGSNNPVKSGGIKTALDAKVKSVNGINPVNGNVTLNAEDIYADGIGDKTATGNPIVVQDVMQGMAKALSVTLEPVQDLHGYDHPWPAGGGKNLLPLTVNEIKAANTTGTWSDNAYTLYGVTYTIQTDGDNNVIGIKVNGTATAKGIFRLDAGFSQFMQDNVEYYVNGNPNGYSIDNAYLQIMTNGWDGYANVAGGEVVTYSSSGDSQHLVIRVDSGKTVSNLVFVPMIRLLSIAGDDFEPYTNICPIYPSGYEETDYPHGHAEVLRRGINQWDEQWEVGAYNPDNGAKISGNDKIRCKNKIRIVPSATYYILTGTETSANAYWKPLFYDKNETYIGTIGSFQSRTLTVPANAYYMTFYMNAEYGTTYNNDISINYPSTETSYHAYSSDSAIIPFTSDVYGGTVNMLTGKGSVTLSHSALSALPWVSNGATLDNTQMEYYASITGKKPGATNFITEDFGEAASAGASYLITGRNNTNGISIRLPISLVPTLEDFNTWIADKGDIVYELATPTEITLTPAQLSLLQGSNILTGDGTINLTYLGSMASNVQDEITEFENGLNNVIASFAFIENQTAKAPHSVGDYIILNGVFCTVISAISAGETLIFGTNIKATTLAAELKAIWAQIGA